MNNAPEQQPPYVVRRRPKFAAFIGVGVLVGVIAAGIWTFSTPMPQDARYSLPSVLGYTGVLLGGLGALIGAMVAIWLDRQNR